ncbi:MAG TPA: aspartate aminotransferase family protein, partial [Solirubrobacterales bacterium]|nr:aspartate aminotransferase family protein [Solirubrobacterales bacterium]
MTDPRVQELTERELARFAAEHRRSGELRDAAADSLLSGVPMNWMTRWPGAFPVVFDSAAGASLTDVDGNAYVDFCLGDTGAMAGHSPAPTVAAAAAR